jgi:5-(carboxyamino)imidazole ribonucleotide mutase
MTGDARSAGSGDAGSVGKATPLVGIVCGSRSDRAFTLEVERVLGKLDIASETRVLSAHRMPMETLEYARTARYRGLKVIIALAGLAAHLPGVVASHTTLPVLGVPLSGGVMGGLDALLSIVQMPGGVPVGCLALDHAGARNAAVLAAQILGLSDPAIVARVEALKEDLARGGAV